MDNIITNYIYLLHEREHIRLSENVYKVGMTRQPNLERFHNHPKGSILLFQMECIDCKFIESIVLQVFKDRFEKCCFYGNEYFRGNKRDMMKILYLIIANEDRIREYTIDRRSNYIESILKEHIIVDKETTDETNETNETSETTNENKETIDENIDTTIENKDNKQNQYHCDKCDYYTSRSFNYVKHIRTDKHKLRSENTTKFCISSPSDSSNGSSGYRCPNCDRKYMAKRSLWRHSKQCQTSSTSDTFDTVMFNIFKTTIAKLCKSK